MKSIKIENGDIVLTSKKLTTVDALEQKIQRTKGILQTGLGELFFNTEIGLNREYVFSIKDKQIDKDKQKLAIIEALRQDTNVESVKNIEVVQDNKKRKTYIKFNIKYKDIEENITGGVEIG